MAETELTEEQTTKPTLSFWQIWNMSFGFLGIQFGFALQNANVSRIFETLGANIDNIPVLWIAAPVTGLIVQPIIGHMSDSTWTRLGRRRPYFLVGAILASAALFIMPFSPVLWMAAGMLWIMDASINISMEPFRAFIGDMMPERQHTTGFAMQSFFIGVGAVIASALPYILTNWIGLSNTATPGEIPNSLIWSFIVGGVVYLGSVLWTVFRSTEYPPKQFQKYGKGGSQATAAQAAEQGVSRSGIGSKYMTSALALIIGFILVYFIYQGGYQKELYIFGLGLLIFGLVMATAGLLHQRGYIENGLVEVMSDLLNMPNTMVKLAFVQFFSWFALFSMWIYMTPAVTSFIYGATDTTSALYNQGANWVGICFAIYNGFAAIIALGLPKVAQWIGRKSLHVTALLVGGASLAGICLISNPTMLIIPMLGVGLAWGSILAMPYAILSAAIPPEKMGVYMGIFNFFIVIPQIVAASILGFMVNQFFGGMTIYALTAGGASMGLAAIFMLFVHDDPK